MKKVRWPGNGYKFTCHRCGFQFPSTEVIKEWTGLYVCKKDWEPRHPQTLIKVHGEKAFPDIVSKDTNEYTQTCDAYSILPMADFGTADCMILGIEGTFDPYQFRYSSVAAWAIAGVAITGMP